MLRKGQHNFLDDVFTLIVKNITLVFLSQKNKLLLIRSRVQSFVSIILIISPCMYGRLSAQLK